MTVLRRIPVKALVTKVAEFYRVDPVAVLGADRRASIWPVRHVAFYLCSEMTPLSLGEIQAELGIKHKASISRPVADVKRRLRREPEYAEEVNSCKRKVAEAFQ